LVLKKEQENNVAKGISLSLTQMVQPPRSRHLKKRMDQKGRRVAPSPPQGTRQQVDRHRWQDDGQVLQASFRSDNSIKNYFYSTVRRNL